MTNQTAIRRKNTGKPGNRGKFDGKSNSEPESALAAAAPAPIEAEVTFEWTERNVLLTPRHRVPRDIDREGTTTITVPSTTAEDAPVGFTVIRNEWEYFDRETGERLPGRRRGEDVRSELVPTARDYRVYDDQLYREVLSEHDRGATVDANSDWIIGSAKSSWRFYVEGGTEAEAAASAQARFGNYLAIDGKLWAKADEPVYRVMTFGMGNNHGGTSLTVESAPDTTDNAADDFYFPADQYDEAVKRAVATAEQRGDTESVKSIQATPAIQVLAPEFVAKSWRPAPRIPERKPAYRLKPGEFPREIAAFRKDIATIPGAVEEIDDGFGGKSHRINYSVLSADQAYRYKEYLKYGADEGLL